MLWIFFKFWVSNIFENVNSPLNRMEKPQTSISGKRATVDQNDEIWDSVVWVIYVQLLNFGPKIYAQISQFWKLACILETAACKPKLNSISTPWGRNTVSVQILEFWPKAKFYAQIWQFWKSTHMSMSSSFILRWLWLWFVLIVQNRWV